MTLVDEYTKERLVRAAKELIGDLQFAQQMGCRELQIEHALSRAKESLMWLEDIEVDDRIEYEETEYISGMTYRTPKTVYSEWRNAASGVQQESEEGGMMKKFLGGVLVGAIAMFAVIDALLRHEQVEAKPHPYNNKVIRSDNFFDRFDKGPLGGYTDPKVQEKYDKHGWVL